MVPGRLTQRLRPRTVCASDLCRVPKLEDGVGTLLHVRQGRVAASTISDMRSIQGSHQVLRICQVAAPPFALINLSCAAVDRSYQRL